MAKTKKDLVDPSIVVGYVRCSTEEQADSGLGLAAQRTAIQAECTHRGWKLLAIHEDAGASGKSVSKRRGRPGHLKRWSRDGRRELRWQNWTD